jgi:hypothetical protein
MQSWHHLRLHPRGPEVTHVASPTCARPDKKRQNVVPPLGSTIPALLIDHSFLLNKTPAAVFRYTATLRVPQVMSSNMDTDVRCNGINPSHRRYPSGINQASGHIRTREHRTRCLDVHFELLTVINVRRTGLELDDDDRAI